MGNLASQQLNTTSDPALVLQQALQRREQQLAAIQNPQQQLAARVGGLLGGGIANVTQGRGFFDVNDPLLNRVTQIQGIYNQVAQQIDPNANPVDFYNALQKAYADAGMGREALMASQEGQKSRVTSLDLQAKEMQALERDVEGIPARIQAAQEAGDDAEVQRLSNIYTRVVGDRELNKRVKEAQIDQAKSSAAANRATAEGKDIIYLTDITGQKLPYERKDGKLVPLVVEGGAPAAVAPGTGKGKFSQGTPRFRYNPVTGKPEPI